MKNKGFSLVELLVAISIAAVVAGSVGYLLTTSLRMFGNETTDVEQQQELQTTLNTIVDYAMESQTVVLNNSGSQTEYLALGTIDDSDSKNLNAEIFFANDNNLYMVKTAINDYEKTQDTSPKNLDERVNQIKTDALSDSTNLPQYLLAENVSSFFVDINGLKTEGTNRYYNNPLSLDIALEFTKMGSSKEINKKVSDKAVLRNTLKTEIYINGIDYGIKKDALEISTETVKLEEYTGNIQIPGTSTVRKRSLNILEIVPDYSYDYVQYVIGGYNGKINSAENVYYDSRANISPVSASEFEGYLLQTSGLTGGNTCMISGYFPNNRDPDLNGIVRIPDSNRNGYFEYVGQQNGGVYAIDSYEVNGKLSLNPGMGESKPRVLGYTRDDIPDWALNDKTQRAKWTEKVFNPVFKYCEYEEAGKDYYMAAETNASTRRDYESVIVATDNETGETYEILGAKEDIYKPGVLDGKTFQYRYYRYVGDGNGTVSLNFYKYNTSNKGDYSRQNERWYAVDESHDAVDATSGEYRAIIDGWETRESGSSSYEWGYDFERIVTSAILYSPYYSKSPELGQDYGWVWHDAEQDPDLYDAIENGEKVTTVGTLEGGYKEAGENYARGTKLYLKGHYRPGFVNNELFKLFVMQDTLEQYVDGSPKMLDILNGRYDESNHRYSEVNDKALKKWEEAGNKITVNVRMPKHVTEADVANCDMVVIGTIGDGGFNFAHLWTTAIKKSNGPIENYSAENDISFSVATEIYKRVCADEISIACPFEINDISDNSSWPSRELNMSKMYKMIYCVSNWTQTDEDLLAEVVGDAKDKKIEEQGENNYWSIDPGYQSDIESQVMRKGSGRDLYKDFLYSMRGEELSKSLYENGTLPDKTTDFIYIDTDGNIVIPGQNARRVTQKVGTTSHTYDNRRYDGVTMQKFDIYTDSGHRNFGNFEATFLLKNYTGTEFLWDRYRTGQNFDDSGHRLYPKTEFVYNEEYDMKYRFYYDSRHTGIYKNALLYMSTSNLFTFYKSGSSGMLQLGVANQNSHPMAEIDDPDDIGTLEYVGADDKESSERRMAALSDSASYKYEDNPTKYAFRLEKLGNGTNKKVFYMSTEDYERAKVEGLYLYVLIKTSKDPTNYNKCVLRFHQNEEDGGAEGRFDYDAFNYETVNNESSGNVIKYAPGDTAKEAYVREYRYHANPEYFQHIYAPNNKGNNYIEARIDAADGRDYRGSDILYFIIRDEFDLD